MDEFYNSDFIYDEEECEFDGMIQIDGNIFYI